MTTDEKRDYMRKLGSKGGKATVARYGRQHMAEIGKRGLQATVDRRFGGNFEAFGYWLSRMGLRAQDPAPWNGAWQGIR